MINHSAAVSIVLGCLLAGGAAAAAPAVSVSPGAEDRLAEIEGRCPTFIWGAEEGAVAHEIVVYRIRDESVLDNLSSVDLESCEEVLYRRVPGTANAWQPELAEALIPGAAYVWFVRAVVNEDGGERLGTGEWTKPRFFSVSDSATEIELERALEVVRRYLDQNPGQVPRLDESTADRTVNAAGRAARGHESGTSSAGSKSVPAATAAIKGSVPDPIGEVYGVVGLSASPDGAGVAAANSGGGPDLVLDGSLDGVADTELSESGINRPSAAAQVFSIGNSSGGGMTLQVDGADVLTTASTIDADTLDGIDGADYATEAEAAGMVVVHAASADHDGRYFTEAELGASGAAAVHWDNLSSVPAGFADGVDNDTTYSIGPGLIVDGGEIRIDMTAFSTTISTVAGTGSSGQDTSIAIGTDGFGLIAYDTGKLSVAHCTDIDCTAVTFTILDGVGTVGMDVSITIGDDGLGLMSYRDATNQQLKVAHCDDTACSSGTVAVIDSSADVGYCTSIAVGTDGRGLISYYDLTNGDLKVAHCDNTSCTTATTSTLDTAIGPVCSTSIAIGTDGLGLISYYRAASGDLKTAHCSNVACTTATTATLDSTDDVGKATSIAIGYDGLGVISYYDATNGDMKVAHCQNIACTTTTYPGRTLASEGDVGKETSIAIGTDGRAVVSYEDVSNGDLKVARCDDVMCIAATRQTTIDTMGVPLKSPSISIGTDGRALISYQAWDGLRVAHVGIGVP